MKRSFKRFFWKEYYEAVMQYDSGTYSERDKEEFIRELNLNLKSSAEKLNRCINILLIGPRGVGKTSFINSVYMAIRQKYDMQGMCGRDVNPSEDNVAVVDSGGKKSGKPSVSLEYKAYHLSGKFIICCFVIYSKAFTFMGVSPSPSPF